MANVKGVTLTLPDGTTFEATGNISIQIEHQHNWLLSGGGTVVGFASNFFSQAGGGSAIKTPMASGHLGAAGGSRVFEIAFDQWEGSADSWGPAAADDPIMEKMAVLDVELAKAEVSSLAPATLEFGPFSSGTSRYDPIPVVVQQASPTLDFGESSSVFRPRITLAETIDLSQAIDGSADVTPEYKLQSSNATDDVPIARDTLGAGGRGTGRQRQGSEVAPSGLAEKNADSASTASPTSQQTKILPESVRLRGAFRGANASDLATRLKDQYLANPDVETVDLVRTDGTSDPLTGTYTIGSDSAIDPIIPQVEGGVYGYDLDLQEV